MTENDIDLNKLLVFYKICDSRNFSAAAKKIRVDKSTLGRTISALEHEIGAKLFERVNRTIILTQEGKYLQEKAASIITELRSVRSEIGTLGKKITGKLRISTTHPIASTWISKFIHHFLAEHPDLRLEIIAGTDALDLSMREADVALRPFCNVHGLKHEHLYRWRILLWAAPSYIEKFGMPMTEDDLDHHRLIVFGDTDTLYNDEHAQWALKRGPGKRRREPFIIVNSLQGMFELVNAGVGIGTFSKELDFIRNSNLIPVLENQFYKETDLFFIYHAAMEENEKVMKFKDFIFKYVKKNANRL